MAQDRSKGAQSLPLVREVRQLSTLKQLGCQLAQRIHGVHRHVRICRGFKRAASVEWQSSDVYY